MLSTFLAKMSLISKRSVLENKLLSKIILVYLVNLNFLNISTNMKVIPVATRGIHFFKTKQNIFGVPGESKFS